MSKIQEAKRRRILKKKLWKVFSAFIRARDKDVCFTCGRSFPGKTQSGHFVPARVCLKNDDLYFSELNVHAQCLHCNLHLGGYGAMYSKRLREKYAFNDVIGIPADEVLLNNINNNVRYSNETLLQKIEYYKTAELK